MDDVYIAEKIEAYHIAIDALLAHESENDAPCSKAIREKLAAKLDRECQRWCNRYLPPTNGRDSQ